MNHKNYIEYFADLKNVFKQSIIETDEEYDKILFDKLLSKVKHNWDKYINEEFESYMLTENEVNNVIHESRDEWISNTLIKLSEMGYVNMSINENGEVLYGLSEDGKEYLENSK